jgi:hypothetical protein
MYQNLMFGVKRRILREIESAFLNHPSFAEKVIVTNKFPYEQRPQYGVVLRNTAASLMRMSADNYMADLYSHVRLANDGTSPGLSVEWVRENTCDITSFVENENLSSQVDPTNRLFFTSMPIVMGKGETDYATSSGQVIVTVNDSQVSVDSVDGKTRTVILANCPHTGDSVKISYWARTLTPPGLYFVTFTEDTEFFVDSVYVIENEILAQRTTGLETTINLAHQTIVSGTDEIFLGYTGKIASMVLVRGTDYSVDYDNGIITFLHPLPTGFLMTIDYRYRPFPSPSGPFAVKEYEENHDAIPGVVISIGKRAKKDDRQIVVVSEFRESQAAIYGGHWDMSLSLGVISKDTRQMEEMTDQIVNWLWGVRKNLMEFEGITLNKVEPTGEAEETFNETTGDLYFESSVDISIMTEWQRFIPHLYKIKHFLIGLEIVADTRPVIKYPTAGYERVI